MAVRTLHTRQRGGLLLGLLGVLLLGPATALGQDHPHRHAGDAPEAIAPLEPQSAEAHGLTRPLGAWTLRLHGFVTSGASAGSSPRNEAQGFMTSMVMPSLSRRAGNGIVTIRIGGSLEPLMGARGYPLLLQTGETADGVLPLRDRQHPHDLIGELSLSYRHDGADGLSTFASAALIGQPAFGPAVFMHRSSGQTNPEAPLTHHYLDGMHISYGVVTAGVKRGGLTILGSGFNGVEPDAHRWQMDAIRLDSYSLQMRVDPHPDVVLQASVADLAQPERLHPRIGLLKLSTSIAVHRQLTRAAWDTTLAFGRDRSEDTVIPLLEAQRIFSPPIVAHYVALADLSTVPAEYVSLIFRSRTRACWLLESNVAMGSTSLFGRYENLSRDELFDPSDQRHSQLYSIGKLSAGVLHRIWQSQGIAVSLGGLASVHRVPQALQADYGASPTSWRLFGRIDLGHAR